MTPTFDAVHPPEPALIDKCVHCGFCLPSCPTYALWGEEMDSPRGRIYLMKSGLADRTPMNDAFVRHFDACLGCMACVTACPSGVQYGPLIEATRGQIERRYRRTFADRLFRSVIFALFPYPGRLRIALLPWSIAARLKRRAGPMHQRRPGTHDGRLMTRVRAMLSLAPPVTPRSLFSRLPEWTRAAGERRLTVGLLQGCVQRVVFPHVNAAAVDVLAAEGCDVVAPSAHRCCGALALHAGRLDEARTCARATIEAFERAGVERIAATAAGCGSSMKEYGQLLADDPEWRARAQRFSSRVRDITEVVAELQPPRAARHPLRLRVAYQDACHLAHAQGVRQPPRDLLASIPGVEILPLADAETCCGSAGIYNLVEPDTAQQLGERKARHIAAVNPDVVATANPGCLLQMRTAAERLGCRWPIVHPIELVAASVRGTPPFAAR